MPDLLVYKIAAFIHISLIQLASLQPLYSKEFILIATFVHFTVKIQYIYCLRFLKYLKMRNNTCSITLFSYQTHTVLKGYRSRFATPITHEMTHSRSKYYSLTDYLYNLPETVVVYFLHLRIWSSLQLFSVDLCFHHNQYKTHSTIETG